MYKRVIASIILAIASVVSITAQPLFAAEKNDVSIYLFWGNGCPHCAKAKEFLEPYVERTEHVELKKYEVYFDITNQQYMNKVGKKLGLDVGGVPLTVVGDQEYIGYSPSISEKIQERVEYCQENACSDSVAGIVQGENSSQPATPSTPEPVETKPAPTNADSRTIDLPLFGKIDTGAVSLPFLTVIIALVDGFNPCAMWALIFIIGLLIGLKDRKRMWLYGVAFIVTSAVVYFLFLAAWLNLFMFIGTIMWVRIAIGLLAVGIGAFYLYRHYKEASGCKITAGKSRRETLQKLKGYVLQKNIWIGLAGIVLLAATVNIVELACSAGLPVVYTGILTASGLDIWQYYGYLLLYILFFMADDLVVFALAMTTLKVIGIESKYVKLAQLVGGVVMLALGILLIFAPGVLMFG